MTVITTPVVTPVAATIATPIANPKAVAIRAPKVAAIEASLLETVRALDGNKEDRLNVAHAALTVAYTVALTYGNKTQLTAVLASTGKKVCEKAMRAAVQEVGVLGMHKDSQTRAQAILDAVNVATSLFAAVACVVKAKQPKAAKVEAPVTPAAGAGDSTEADTDTPAAAPIAAAQVTESAIVSYAESLPDAQLAALTDRLVALIEARTRTHLKAA